MNLIVYTCMANEASRRLIDVVSTCSDGKAVFYYTIDGLAKRLVRPKTDHTIVILHIATEKEFSEILSLAGFFQNTRLILILPNRGSLSISRGHRLYPRYLSYVDSDFSDVCAVLGKMINNACREKETVKQQDGIHLNSSGMIEHRYQDHKY